MQARCKVRQRPQQGAIVTLSAVAVCSGPRVAAHDLLGADSSLIDNYDSAKKVPPCRAECFLLKPTQPRILRYRPLTSTSTVSLMTQARSPTDKSDNTIATPALLRSVRQRAWTVGRSRQRCAVLR